MGEDAVAATWEALAVEVARLRVALDALGDAAGAWDGLVEDDGPDEEGPGGLVCPRCAGPGMVWDEGVGHCDGGYPDCGIFWPLGRVG